MSFAFRPMVMEDTNFIVNSWIRSMAGARFDEEGQPTFQGQSQRRAFGEDFYWVQQPVIEHLLVHANVTVAYPEEEPEIIAAWACTSRRLDDLPVVHYLFTKFAYRRQGLAKQLVERAIGNHKLYIVTHRWPHLNPPGVQLHFDPLSIVTHRISK